MLDPPTRRRCHTDAEIRYRGRLATEVAQMMAIFLEESLRRRICDKVSRYYHDSFIKRKISATLMSCMIMKLTRVSMLPRQQRSGVDPLHLHRGALRARHVLGHRPPSVVVHRHPRHVQTPSGNGSPLPDTFSTLLDNSCSTAPYQPVHQREKNHSAN